MLFVTALRALLASLTALLLSTTTSHAASLERIMAAASAPRNASVSYDPLYDDSYTPASAVSCSDWMVARGYPTLGALPSFPHVGGADTVDGADSAACGQCVQLTYGTPTETSVHVLVVDGSKGGFTIARRAMDDLADGQAATLGRVNAVGTVVARAHCGM